MSGGTGERKDGSVDPIEPRGAVDGAAGGDLAHAPPLALGSDEETRTSAPARAVVDAAPIANRAPVMPGGETRADETRDERRPGTPRSASVGPARDLPFVDPS